METALPTLLGRRGRESPAMLYKSDSSSALGMPADRKMPVIADGGRSVVGSFESKSQQRMRRSFSTTQLEQRSISVLQRRRSLRSLRSEGDVGSIAAKTFKAEQKSPPMSPPSFKHSEQTFLDERGWTQLPEELQKLFVDANQSSLDSYAKFKQRRAITKELNCPLDTAKDAQGLFNCHAKKGILKYKNFRDIVVEILKSAGQELSEEDMEKKIEVSWREVDRNYSGKVDFEEFAIWYSSWGFQEELLLSPTKIRTRDLARQYNLSIADVDSVHSKFQFFDEDGSGDIEFPEFKKLLYKLLKVPKEAELPATRLQHFWKEIDIDGSGSVCFAEFLQWYIKYFDIQGTANISPMEQFYQSMRPNVGRW